MATGGTSNAIASVSPPVIRSNRPPRPRRRASLTRRGAGVADPNVARIAEARRAAMDAALGLGGGGGNRSRFVNGTTRSPAAAGAADAASADADADADADAAVSGAAMARVSAQTMQTRLEKHLGGGRRGRTTYRTSNGPPLTDCDYTVPLKRSEAEAGAGDNIGSRNGNIPNDNHKHGGRSVGFVTDVARSHAHDGNENDDNASLLSQEASITSAALAVQRGALRGSYEGMDHRMASDVSVGSHFDLDLTSVTDTTITTKHGSPMRHPQSEHQGRIISSSLPAGSGEGGTQSISGNKHRNRRKNKRKARGKKVFPKSSILRIRTSAQSILSRSSRKKQSARRSKSNRSMRDGDSSSSILSWKTPRKAVSFAGDRISNKSRGKRKKKNKLSDSSTAASTILTMTKKATRDAFMCGLCGAAFSSYAKAEAHENRCVQDAFSPVGSSPTSRKTISPSAAAIAPLVSPPVQQQQQIRSSPTTRMIEEGNPVAPSPRSPHSDDTRGRANTADAIENLQQMGGNGTRETSACDRRLYLSPAPERDDDVLREPVPKGRKRAYTESFLEHPHAASGTPSSFRSERPRRATKTEPLRIDPDAPKIDAASGYDIQTCRTDAEPGGIHLSDSMRRYILMTDEAIVKVVSRATPHILNPLETDAERELALLARDRAYYEMLEARISKRMAIRGKSRSIGVGEGFVSTVKGRFSEAYRLIKEGDEEGEAHVDQYTMKNRSGGKSDTIDIDHNDSTLYINVVVKNSVNVISNELKRLAKSRWETQKQQETPRDSSEAFEWFRAVAQLKVVQLAGIALASDFTPRRIAVQLSNDLYRLLGPTLKSRGVTIQTEIEYRAGAYFVLAVNIQKIDWVLLMKHANQQVLERRRRWKESQLEKARKHDAAMAVSSQNLASNTDGGDAGIEEKESSWRVLRVRHLFDMFRLPSIYELIGQCLALLYYPHWIISVPICMLFNFLFLEKVMKRYILTSTTDDIFYYVEQKGMEMDLSVKDAKDQASFMMAALREMRSDEKARKKKKAQAEGEEEATVLGPLLGPAIKEDRDPAVPPPDFVPPDNLEDVNFEMDLPVGFRRLRWAVLHKDSSFVEEAVMKTESKHENITMGEWDKHGDTIGLPRTPDGVNEADYIGAVLETSYLMPKSAFVSANMAYETQTIAQYDDYCIVIKKATRTPDVPYGGTFIAHTQIVITNTGNNSCKLVCSVEAEFPNGPPMVGRQIKSGMRAGTADAFVIFGETICKYAEHFP